MAIKVDSSDCQDNLNSIIPYLEGSEVFDGLNNTDILNYQFDEKVYQFDTHVLENEFKCSLEKSEDTYKVFIQRIIPGYTITGDNPEMHPTKLSNPIYIGTIAHRSNNLIDKYLKEEYACTPLLYGGRYKKVIVNDDGSDHVKPFREPYSIKLKFMKKQPEHHTYTPDEILELNSKYQNNQQNVSQDNKWEAGCGCSILLIVFMAFFVLFIFILTTIY